jgi:hypothetical protein
MSKNVHVVLKPNSYRKVEPNHPFFFEILNQTILVGPQLGYLDVSATHLIEMNFPVKRKTDSCSILVKYPLHVALMRLGLFPNSPDLYPHVILFYFEKGEILDILTEHLTTQRRWYTW